MCIQNISLLIGVSNIIAILLAPIIAIIISLWIGNKRNKRQDKIMILKELMANKKNDQEQFHRAIAQALNLIDVVFVKDKRVLEKYHIYRDVLLSLSPNPLINKLSVDLLKEIALNLNYQIPDPDLDLCVGYKELQIQAQPYLKNH